MAGCTSTAIWIGLFWLTPMPQAEQPASSNSRSTSLDSAWRACSYWPYRQLEWRSYCPSSNLPVAGDGNHDICGDDAAVSSESKRMKILLLRLLISLSIGVLATLIVEVVSLTLVFTFGFPGNDSSTDDMGWDGVAIFGIFLIIAFVGVPLFSMLSFFLLRRNFLKK